MKTILKYIGILTIILAFAACGSDDSGSSEPARMSVKMVDMPGDYEAVFVDVQDVVIKYNGDSDNDEVAIGEVNAGVYDLLELTAGVSVLLVDDEVPAGDISQIRLILGNDNSIVVDGTTFPLSTPSAQQSGLKIQVNETLEGGVFYEFILDFDVERSIVEQGNGGYSLKPVIRATTEAQSGAISGAVMPIGVQTLITATSGSTEISTFANDAGVFVLSGVPNGTYTLTFEADADAGLETEVLENVVVVNGEVTAVGTVDLTL